MSIKMHPSVLSLAICSIGITTTVCAGTLDSTRYEIQDIRVATDLAHGHAYQIYANGKMQAPVYIKVKAIDSKTQQPITIPTNELISATYLYGKQSGLNLTYNQYLSDSHDQHWVYTATENQYQHTVPRSSGIVRRSVSSNPTTIHSNRRLGNGWSQFTYWVTTNQTHYSKHICAEISTSSGSHINSCNTMYDEYATISAIDPIPYHAADFSFDFHYLKQANTWYVGYWQLTPKDKHIKMYGLEWVNPLQQGNRFFRAMDYFRPGGGLLIHSSNTMAYSLILYPYKPSIERETIKDYVRMWDINGKKRDDYHFELPLSTNNLKFVQGKGSYDDFVISTFVGSKLVRSHTKRNGYYVNTSSNDRYHYDLRPKFRVYDQFGNVAHLKLVDSNTVGCGSFLTTKKYRKIS